LPLKFLPSRTTTTSMLVDVGATVGQSCERVRVTGVAAPGVGVDGLHSDVAGVGPVVVKAFPHTAGAFPDVSVPRALAVHLQVVIGAPAEYLRAARAKVRERGDELLRRGLGGLIEMNGGHRYPRKSARKTSAVRTATFSRAVQSAQPGGRSS
jgi:hypothetical protein